MPRKRKTEPSVFGRILSDLMKKEGLTNAKVGAICGVSASTVNDWRQGASPSERIKAVKKLADFFGVSLSFLLLGEEQELSASAKVEREQAFVLGGEVLLSGVYELTVRKLIKK